MYLVGHLTKAHGNEPPQWEVFALRRTRKRALVDCLEGKVPEGSSLGFGVAGHDEAVVASAAARGQGW
jgi:hypothetical protein